MCVVILVCLAVESLSVSSLSPARVRDAVGVALLLRLPADPRCGHPTQSLAALVQGRDLGPEGCPGELVRGEWSAAVLGRVARDPRQPVAVRSDALEALLLAPRLLGNQAQGLPEALLSAPPSAPAMRRAAFDRIAASPEGAEWVERGRAIGVHGLGDRAAVRQFALGEPDVTEAAARALGATPPERLDPLLLADVFAGLGITPADLFKGVERHAAGQRPRGVLSTWDAAFWRHDCAQGCVPLLLDILAIEMRLRGEEPGEPQPVAPGADAAIDVMYAGSGERGDHVREELAAAAGWVRRVPAGRRAARLVSAVLHPGGAAPSPAELLAEEGDLHAVLLRAGGAPGTTALVARDLGLATGVPVKGWTRAVGVGLQVGGQILVLDRCAAPARVSSVGADWEPVPDLGFEALALVEGAAAALRDGEVGAARAAVDAARRSWAGAPGVDAVDAAVRAAGGSALEPPLLGPPPTPGPATRFVSRTAHPGGRAGRGAETDPRALARAALEEQVDQLVSVAHEPGALVRAAWWAAWADDGDLARRLLARRGMPSAEDAELWASAAVRIGEPGDRAPEVQARRGGCPRSMGAEPPPALFARAAAPARARSDVEGAPP